MAGVVIIGAGQAAASAAAKLRALKYDGEITLLGDEPHPPYQRPPLSKAYLLGQLPQERLWLRPHAFWQDRNIQIETSTTAIAIDRAAQQVLTRCGPVGYDHLILATGARPHRLPDEIGGDLAGVFTLRGLADIDRLTPAIARAANLLVVGGGYIGLEAAAVGRLLGKSVTVIEAAPRILGRVASAETAEALRDIHQLQGVTVLEGCRLARLQGTAAVEAAVLADGRCIPVDLVIVGIGVTPNVELASAAGLEIDNGIALGALLRSSDPQIWAAGDCASFLAGGARLRLESVGNAVEMGELVAANIMGADKAYLPQPWFWSEQYDAKLQIAGFGTDHDRVVVRKADGQSFWYYREGRLIALDALNDARAYMIGKKMINDGITPDPAAVADPAVDLKTLLA